MECFYIEESMPKLDQMTVRETNTSYCKHGTPCIKHIPQLYHHFEQFLWLYFMSLQHAVANRPNVFSTLVSFFWCIELFNWSANCKYDTNFMPYFISLQWLQHAFLDIFTLICRSYFLYIAKCCKLLYVVSCTV